MAYISFVFSLWIINEFIDGNSFNELILSDFKLPGKYNVPYQINNLA